ncbi:MAG: helix-turn-helix transcriptional regulator [Nitrospira sp. SB0667_bin_9]|nr:helix-turn-helix transcriptional regulator [Nitrospira sp. SB0667_bin_9]MYD31671.1 helix-turn-helix transcriptional regulator [Nitrospira sp. SB0661_bin_20]MYJ23297.1 helix-turn-helix transcriptional regulator [Nitrospira sp. SB0673_bin_12]
MNQQDKFGAAISSLHEAALGNTSWRETSALIDDLCGMKGTHLVIVDGRSKDEPEWLFDQFYYHGESYEELGREYATVFFPQDERIPRLMRLPDCHIAHVTNLWTAQELKTSPTYHDLLRRTTGRDGLNIRMDGPNGLDILWALADPTESAGWNSRQIKRIECLLPHLRQFVRVRQALANAQALGASLVDLLDNSMVGVIYLDYRGRIVETNDQAYAHLRDDAGLSDQGGFLRAWKPADNAKLKRLLARAIPKFRGNAGLSGSMVVERLCPLSRLMLHIIPVPVHSIDFGIPRISTLVLIVDPGAKLSIDSDLIAATLGLTRAESCVAASLAEGSTIRDIAVATYRAESSVRWHIKQIHAKLGISKQADLVRIVYSMSKIPKPRP